MLKSNPKLTAKTSNGRQTLPEINSFVSVEHYSCNAFCEQRSKYIITNITSLFFFHPHVDSLQNPQKNPILSVMLSFYVRLKRIEKTHHMMGVIFFNNLIVMNLPNGTNDLVTLKPWGPTLVDNRPLPIEPLARSSPAKGLLGTLLASLFLVQCSMWLYNHRPALANRTRLYARLCQSG